ncbi:putative 60S acidic ribosomal protein [Leishmania major strain Friedlin]|uniref:Ribosome assembly factor mrt4 n=1 Tax=Leishmania major TaxID=5664 RepID=Q4Q0U9_LEIMA|nr:putative 60S acidic ribosomal protein [Leishmania major strain Friedlin]CAG9584013.1 60S_acidic_ribosomal_protein_-_putative [Leishmania major strain Friedlin]CAJ09434.1 putative 60S acidic ribosomal protein [Leishmania major strain Friedlin]|eukprot:XP_001687049.1 putative 60S acidic ribosomal protein [Leishmania major strain Friedlin]
MPKSKRAKIVPLTKTQAKTREDKDKLIERIREALEDYSDVYTFQLHNIRTNILQQIREERAGDSRIFLGNNKVMMIAIGRDEESAQRQNLHKLSPFLTGLCGLLFTNLSKKEVKEYFATVGAPVYARTGQTATESLVLKGGPLPQFPHSMFDHLAKLGLPIKLDRGVIVLLQDTTVCEPGDTLSAEAAQLLKLFGVQSAKFKMDLTAHWTSGVAKKVSSSASKRSEK